jgi:predicted metalloprotease
MRWTPGTSRQDVEDRRAGGGGGGFLPGGGMRIGLGGVIVLLVLSLVFKQDFLSLLAGGAPERGAPSGAVESSPEEERLVDFVTFVLNDAQSTWERLLPEHGVQYRHAKLVLFRDAIQSACGFAQAATGPFYCPGDEKVYIDLGFYDELRSRFGARGGPFAEAYVIAHEYGHHVQHLLGTDRKVGGDRQGATSGSVRLELQADCYAGVWAAHAVDTGYIENLTRADIADGLDAAAAVGDDRIQRQATGRVDPETWTHGSAAERQRWFDTGYKSGDANRCDTFAASAL